MRALSDGERSILQQDGPGDTEDGPSILEHRTSIARKVHICDTCGCGSIAVGEKYQRVVTLDGSEFKIEHYCLKADPPKEGNWACESERLQHEQRRRDEAVSYLIADGAMTEEAANLWYEAEQRKKAEIALAKQAETARRNAESAKRPQDPDADLPF